MLQGNQRLETDSLPRKSHWEAHGKQREEKIRLAALVMARRFPPPWTAELTPNCFIVRDADGQALSPHQN